MTCHARQCSGIVSASVPSQSKMRARGGGRWGLGGGMGQDENSKFQTPSSRETPNPKLQKCWRRAKSDWEFGAWALVFLCGFTSQVSQSQSRQLFLQIIRHQWLDNRINVPIH